MTFDIYDAVNAACDDAIDYEIDENTFARGFMRGAEWCAAGMAVCAFLEDLARLRASPPTGSSDDVKKHLLNQIEAFSTAMRRTWG